MIRFLFFALAIAFYNHSYSQSGPGFSFPLPKSYGPGGYDFNKMDLKEPDPYKRVLQVEEFNQAMHALMQRSDKPIRLDSIIDIHTGGSKTISFQYTSNDKTYTTEYKYRDQTGSIIFGYREIFTYNEYNQVSQFDLLNMTYILPDWIYSNRREFEYNADHALMSITDYDWNGTGLEPYNKTFFSYNNADLLITELNTLWDENLSAWVENTKDDFTYTPFKQLKTAIFSFKNPGSSFWTLATKTEYAYGQGLLLNSIYYYWTTFWEPQTRSDYSYDGHKNLVSQLDKIWRTDISFWYNEYLTQYAYDLNDREVSVSTSRWIEGGFEWYKDDSTAVSYSMDGDTSVLVKFGWSNSDQAFLPENKTEFSHDAGIDFSDILWPESVIEIIGNGYQKKVTGKTMFEFDPTTQFWIPVDSIHYYYSLTTKTKDISIEKISVFPNPASNQIRIDLSDLTSNPQLNIYDMDGKSVLSIPFISNQKISIQQLTPGTYGLIIVNADNIYAGKLIIQR